MPAPVRSLIFLIEAAALPAWFGVSFVACRTMETAPPLAGAAIDQPTFALIDTDADGRVSPAEMAAHQHQEGLAEVDLDNDKRVSPAEWKAARPSAPPNDGTFARLDLNRDGFLAENEAVAHIVSQPVFLEAFKKMDANGDGHLHWEEYAAGNPASLNVTFFSAGLSAAPAREGE